MSRIGILGGTFDPVHLGHLILASFAVDELRLDKVLFMPAQTPPHKLGVPITATHHRVEMLRRAIESDSRFELSRLDLAGDHPSYTSDLLRRFVDHYPAIDIHFLIGADSLREFPTWHEPQSILGLARLGVARRPGVAIDDAVLNALPSLRERTSIFLSPQIDISSTAIRQRVAGNRPITWLVPAPVEKYIEDMGLYR